MMGRLFLAEQFATRTDTPWYFPTARWHESGRWQFDVSESYPFIAAIHNDVWTNRWQEPGFVPPSRVEIRRWIERNLTTDVVTLNRSNTYYLVRRAREPKSDPDILDVPHGYQYFHFETDADAILFRLQFSEHVREVTDRHPDYPPDDDYLFAEDHWKAQDLKYKLMYTR